MTPKMNEPFVPHGRRSHLHRTIDKAFYCSRYAILPMWLRS
jgi:hypothetical protein